MGIVTNPVFLTGSNAKIQVNGITLAFATDIRYSISIPHLSPKILGQYESDSIEPLSYDVEGSFTVIRYVRDAKKLNNVIGTEAESYLSESGNGIGNWGRNRFDGQAYNAADPNSYKRATTFDIVIYQKTINVKDQLAVARIRQARITRMDFTMNKDSSAFQRFSFTANYIDEDSFLANYSGPIG